MTRTRHRAARREKISTGRRRTPFGSIVWTLLAVSVLGVMAYVVLWHLMADAMRGHLERRFDEARRNGFVLRIPRIDETGFPSRVAVTLSGLSARLAGDGARISFSLGGARLETLPWRPDQLLLEGRGLRLALGAIDLTAERIAGTIGGTREGAAFSLELDRAALFLPFLGESALRPARLKIAGLTTSAAPDPSESASEEMVEEPLAWRIGILAEDIAIGERRPARGAEGRRNISAIEVQIAWHGPAAWPPTRKRLVRWRDAGGTLDVERFVLHMATSVLKVDGTLSLDERMRPLGAFTLHVVQPRPLLDSLVLHGLVSLPEARAIGRRIAAHERETGVRGKVELPLMIADGRVTIDGVPLGRIAPLD